MTKALAIEPEQVFAREVVHPSDIPVNAYNKSIAEEAARYSLEDFLDIWRDMCAIREFENILNEVKLKGAYRGITYDHAGPAHLSMGQEAAAVGMAFALALRTTSSVRTVATARSWPRPFLPSGRSATTNCR